MITVSDAQAAYNRCLALNAWPGDMDLLVAAAQQGGMPQPITDLGNALSTVILAGQTCLADPIPANVQAWTDANNAVADLVGK